MLVAQALGAGMHQLEGMEDGARGGEGGLPFLLELFLFVSSALYLFQCPLSSLGRHTKDWRGLEAWRDLEDPSSPLLGRILSLFL